MSGVDTVRGINYQHCHALLAALDVIGDEDLAGIRVEGTDDVLDLEIHAHSRIEGRGTVVSRGFQMKSRLRPYSWAKSELLAIVRRWAGRPVSTTSEFALLTDGELGPTGLAVAEALQAARGGDLSPIAEFLGVSVNDPLCAVAAKATIVSEPGTVESLLLVAEREVRARLVAGPAHPDSEQEAVNRVNELFVLISTRSGLSDPDQRMISRAELLNVLGGVSRLTAADRWAEGLGEEYVDAAATEEVDSVVVPSVRTGGTSEMITIAELLGTPAPILLSGGTGSGKSTIARLWRASSAIAGVRVVVCHAESYLPQGLDRAVSDAVGDIVGRDLPRVVGGQVLGDPATTLVIDGVSEVPAQFRSALAQELHHHLSGGKGARVVLIGRDEGVCASVLPAEQSPTRLYPHSFDEAQRLALTAKFLAKRTGALGQDDPQGAAGADWSRTGVDRSDRFAHDCRVALAQVEHALGDAAGNPMLLGLALDLVAGGIAFTERASLYELTIDRMAARTNVADIRIASAVLGIVFARLLDQGRRYANSLEWARLFGEAVSALEAFGVVTAPSNAREAVERSGLINAVMTGIGRTRLLAPVHDSFADYFAARAHADGFVSLPVRLTANDENRIIMSAQMSMLSDVECLEFAAQSPFTLVRLSESDHRPNDEESPRFVAALLNEVLPDEELVNVTMWADEDRSFAQLGTPTTGWVSLHDAPSLFAGLTAIGERNDGPVITAVRLWRLILRQRFARESWLRPRNPQSCEEARDQLVIHSRATIDAVQYLINKVAPPAATDRLAVTIGPQGMTGIVYRRQQHERLPSSWPVRYRRTADTSLMAAGNTEAPSEVTADEFTHLDNVDWILSTSPKATAAKRVSEAINKLTRKYWL